MRVGLWSRFLFREFPHFFLVACFKGLGRNGKVKVLTLSKGSYLQIMPKS